MASSENNNQNNLHPIPPPNPFGTTTIPIDSIEIHLNFEHVYDPNNNLRQPVYGPENNPELELIQALPVPPPPLPPSNPPTPEPNFFVEDDDDEMFSFFPEDTERSTVMNSTHGHDAMSESVGSVQFGSVADVVMADDSVDSRPSEPTMSCGSRNN